MPTARLAGWTGAAAGVAATAGVSTASASSTSPSGTELSATSTCLLFFTSSSTGELPKLATLVVGVSAAMRAL